MKRKEIFRESFTRVELPIVEKAAKLTNCQMKILRKRPFEDIFQIRITSEKSNIDFSRFRETLVLGIQEARKTGIL